MDAAPKQDAVNPSPCRAASQVQMSSCPLIRGVLQMRCWVERLVVISAFEMLPLPCRCQTDSVDDFGDDRRRPAAWADTTKPMPNNCHRQHQHQHQHQHQLQAKSSNGRLKYSGGMVLFCLGVRQELQTRQANDSSSGSRLCPSPQSFSCWAVPQLKLNPRPSLKSPRRQGVCSSPSVDRGSSAPLPVFLRHCDNAVCILGAPHVCTYVQ